MGARIGLIKVFVFITMSAILLEDHQAECRRGGIRVRTSGGSTGGGSGWLYFIAIIGGIVVVCGCIYGCTWLIVCCHKQCQRKYTPVQLQLGDRVREQNYI